MSTEISPSLAALLEELPSGGKLFRINPRQLVLGLRDGVEAIGDGHTGLLPVERELLRVHREELAAVLLDECRVKLYGSEAFRRRLLPGEVPRRDEARLAAATERVDEIDPELVVTARPDSVLAWIERANSIELAHQSMRLCPSHRGRLLQALECRVLWGQERTGRRILLSLTASGVQGAVLSMACGQLADAFGHDGRPDTGLDVLKPAVRAPVFSTGVNMLLLGLAAEEESSAMQGAELLDAYAGANPGHTGELVANRREDRRSGRWPDSAPQTAMAERTMNRFTGPSRDLINVILSTE